MMDGLTKLIMVTFCNLHVYQTIILYMINLYNIMFQLYLKTAGKKKNVIETGFTYKGLGL